MENFHFFLSYSRNIYFEIVEKIVKELERYGLTIWLDKTEVSLGCQIYDNINLTLKKALEYHGAILIIDKSYLNKEWCNYEADFFIKAQAKTLVILYQLKKEDLPEKYNSLKELNLATMNSSNDIDITVDKILMSFVNSLQPSQEQICCSWESLKNAISYLNKCKQLSDNYAFICDIICRILENKSLLCYKHQNILFPCFEIIHRKVNKLYLGQFLSYYEHKLIQKTICYILSCVNIDR